MDFKCLNNHDMIIINLSIGDSQTEPELSPILALCHCGYYTYANSGLYSLQNLRQGSP